MPEQGLHLDQVEIRLRDALVIALDTCVAPGEVMSVMGPSGVGKSTLLAAISGTLAPAFTLSGRVRLNGRDITDLPIEARRVGVLFQDELLFPHLSVGANLAFGLPAAIKGAKARRAAVATALAEVGLDGMVDRDPATLSGGQKARVALMRMLLSDPHALLLDEAFSRLDTERRAQTRDLVFGAARARGLPVLQVTHDRSDAEAAGGPVHHLT
jgi:putative thiamine transport system ATP-binding protein